jgi:type II secretory pathway component PulK
MKDRRGFALLSAIWLVVAIAVAGLQLALETRRSTLAAINLTHDVQARTAASAAFDLTRARVDQHLRRAAESGPYEARLALSDPWMSVDTAYSLTETFGVVDVHILIRSVGSQLNINRATEQEFLNFLIALEFDYSTAEELSQTIMDWRDTDDNYRARGAERDFYVSEGLLNLPRNNLFESVGELRYVQGMTEDIFEIASPYLTVWGTGRINLNTADFPVLMSLSGMTEAAASYLISLRENGERLTATNQLQPYLASGVNLPNNRTAVTVDELEIESLATAADGRPILRGFGVIRRGTGQSTLTNWRVE